MRKFETNQRSRSHARRWVVAVIYILILGPALETVSAQNVQTGRIIGKIVQKETGEALIGAVVTVENTKLGAQSDLDGNYIINNVPVGTYRLIAQSVGFTRIIVENAAVTAGQAMKMDFAMQSEAIVGDEVVVEASRLKDSESSLLSLRQQAPAAQDAISSEAISRAGAGDAAAAMTRITGASVESGKYAVIRGLSGRYSSTSLNGSQLPSTDPDRPAVQMDLMPTGLLDNIVVQKTFTPDQPGNFSGGAVNLNTKDLPEKLSVKLSSSVSYNDNVTWRDDVISHNGASSEKFGYDNGFRDPPAIIADSSFRVPGYSTVRTSPEGARYLDQAAKSLSRDFSFNKRSIPLNQGYSLSFGNLYQMFDRPLGVIGSLTYNRSYSYTPDGVYRRFETNAQDGKLLGLGIFQDYADEKASEEVLWGGLFSANFAPSSNHKLRFTFNRNQHGEKVSRRLEGQYRTYTESESQLLRSYAWQYTERSMQAFQYGGDHSLNLPALNRTRLEWNASFSTNQQDDPDLRYWTDIANYDDTGAFVDAGIVTGFPFPTHYFRYLTEKNRELKADWSIPLSRSGSSVKIGSALIEKSRNQDNWMLRLNPTQSPQFFSSYNGDPASILVDDKLGIVDSTFDSFSNKWTYRFGIVPENLSRKTDTYRGEQNVAALYGMFDWKLSSKFDVIAGARWEETDQWVESLDSSSRDFRGAYEVSDWLPSVNLVYHALPNMNLRGAFSITTARPTIREMAPFYSFEFLTGNNNIGNPRLTRTLIRNYDLRWEWFTRPGEVIAVSGFFKNFTDPIERFNISDNSDVSFLNVPKAQVYGAEIEFRRRLDHTGIGLLKHFQIGGNLTLVQSEVDIDPTELAYRVGRGLLDSTETKRAFGGQSPYVVNFEIIYSSPSRSTEIALLYNVYGDRLAEVGYRAPDVYEQERHVLDLTLSRSLLGLLTAKLTAKNLLNEDRFMTQEAGGTQYTRSLVREGRSFSLGLSYSL